MDLVVHEVIDKEVYKEMTKGVEEVNKKLVKENKDFLLFCQKFCSRWSWIWWWRRWLTRS